MNNSSKNIGVPFSEKMSNNKRIKENMMKRPPKKIIEEAVKKSTGITESRQVAELVDNVMKAESVARNGDYDVFLYGVAESIESINNGSTPADIELIPRMRIDADAVGSPEAERTERPATCP
jgi:hypothetical protein